MCEGYACHGVELVFVFGTAELQGQTPPQDEILLSNQTMSYWTNFAKTGNPNNVGLTRLMPLFGDFGTMSHFGQFGPPSRRTRTSSCTWGHQATMLLLTTARRTVSSGSFLTSATRPASAVSSSFVSPATRADRTHPLHAAEHSCSLLFSSPACCYQHLRSLRWCRRPPASLMASLSATSYSGSVRSYTHNAVDINIHAGIPYASPPTGPLRFQQSVAAEPWPGILDASTLPPACPQFCDLPPGGCPNATDEMCLYLNINSPANASSLPVMVWIHGGKV